MKQLFFIFTLLFSINCIAQKQGNIWYFGDGAGLDFKTGSPVAITNGQINLNPQKDSSGQIHNLNSHSEGSAVICDSSGSLLFYTNGEKVWNKNHQIMPNGNGLLGHYSSTQSALIVPQPGSDQIFYLFTTDSWYQDDLVNGFRYSIINMCLEHDLGDVVDGKKNILLLDTVSEKLTVVKHSNGTDYWIITHKYFSDKFYAYKLTKSGIVSPVISSIGSVHKYNCPSQSSTPTQAAIGYMKASPNGKKLALVCVNSCDNLKELFDFDNASGTVSNFIDLELQKDTFGGYGLSFSPDNSKLYYTDLKNIFQYELYTGNADSIRNSKTQISSFTSFTSDAVLALKLGPDGKIYAARGDEPFLAVISDPNKRGISCNFTDNAVSLNKKKGSMGLPNFIDSYNYHNKSVICDMVGIEKNIYEKNFIIYPNPTSSSFIIEYKTSQREQLYIYNMLGQTIYTDIWSPFQSQKYIDIPMLTKGIYIVRIGEKIEKLVVE